MFKTVSAKLAAPFLLFLVPIAFLLFFLVRTHDRGIASTRNELSGLPSIRAALVLSNALIGWGAQGSPGRVQLSALRAAEQFDRDLRLWPEQPYAQERLRDGRDLARELAGRKTISLLEITQALDTLADLVQAVGDASELILDPELDTYYLMDLLVNRQPELLAGFWRLESERQAVAAATQGSAAVRSRLEGYRQTLSGLLYNYQRSHVALMRYARETRTGQSLNPAFNELIGLFNEVNRDAVADNRQIVPTVDYVMDAMIDATTSTADELARLLRQRIATITHARDQQIIFSLLMFVAAVIAMLVLIGRLVGQPIQRLTRAMLDLAGGDVNIMLTSLGRKDEIGAMSRAVLVFKENSLRKRVLEDRARLAAQALEQTASTLQRAERIGGMGHWRFDYRSGQASWSPALFDLAGFPIGDPPRFRDMVELVEPGSRPLFLSLAPRALAGRAPVECVVAYRHPDKGLRHLRLIVEVERDEAGQPLTMITAVHDITTIKDHERRLEARTEALAEAQAMGRIGNWSWRLGDALIHWSPEVYHLLKLDPAMYEPRRTDVFARCETESARRLLSAEAEVIRTRDIKAVDITVLRGDGSNADFTVTSKAELDETGRVIGVFGTIQDISERKNAERELEKLAFFDPLSGLANRALFHRAIRQATDNANHDGREGALLMLDLDRFKEVNDSLGHQAGDELLVKVSERLRRNLPHEAFLARLGGDEFAAILPEANRDGALVASQCLISVLSEPIRLSMGEVSIGTSVGIAMMPTDGASADELMRHADLALYRAKESGRGCAEFFKPEFSEFAQQKIRLARDLAVALQRNEGLHLVYQPQIDLRTGAVCGFEALVRWSHPTRGNIPPSEFVPIAESSKLICDLGLWVLRAACAQIRIWSDQGHPLREVAVNVSAAQFWHSDMEHDIADAIREAGISPELLCVEVTESVFMREGEGRVRKALDAIRQLGVQLALDDFGTGYSSLGYLNRFPFDKLKIDRSFVEDVHLNPDKRKLLTGIVNMSRALGKRIVAEGAEKTGEVSVLTALGCDIVQGYVFSRPLPPDEAVAKAFSIEEAAVDEAGYAA